MRPIYEDPELAEQVIGLLSKELKESRATIQALTAGSIGDSGETQSSASESIVALNTKYTLAQNRLNETTVSLEAAKQEIGELRETATLARSGRQLEETKTELEKAIGRAEAAERAVTNLEQMVTYTGERIDRNYGSDIGAPKSTSASKLIPGIGTGGISDTDQSGSAFKRPSTQIQVSKNRQERSTARSSLPTWRKPAPNLIDSFEFDKLWRRNLRINAQTIPDRNNLLIPFSDELSWSNFAPEILCLPQGLLQWGLKRVNAIAFWPFHVLDNGQWKKERLFSDLNGQTLELFVTPKFGVSYAGTYRCRHAEDWFPEGVRNLQHIPYASLSNCTVNQEQKSPQYAGSRLNTHYKSGELRADCMVLEYVGFDYDLYEKFKRSSTNVMTQKRKANDHDHRSSYASKKQKK
ncbi:hypothetical protein DXG01_006727 [Tephrocybe rancida]|nr:hypothetical protein DXG01_006727 [Tephrocybe rancida]